jgi:hypothetical protein
MKKLTFLVLCVAVMAAEPIVKVGKYCPYGHRESGNYCIPNAPTKPVIAKIKNCPVGYRASGNYCIKN